MTLYHLPKKRGVLKSTPKISLFWEATFEVSHNRERWSDHEGEGEAIWAKKAPAHSHGGSSGERWSKCV